jgi:tetratricopeptide (TPR) repeat protein
MALQGHLHKAEALLSQAIPPLEQAGNWVEWCRALAYRSAVLTRMGNYARGLAEIQRVRARAREMNMLTWIQLSDLLLVQIHVFGGDLSRALEATRRMVEEVEHSRDRLDFYEALRVRCWAADRAGQYAVAAACAAKAQAVAQELGGRLSTADLRAAIDAEIALGAGRMQEALALAGRAVGLAQEVGGIFAEGLARRAWGQALAALVPPVLSAAEGPRWDEAEAQLAESLRLLEAGPARLEAARTHVAWGAVCRDRGDLAAARAHWERAAAQWKASGLAHELARTRALIESLSLA